MKREKISDDHFKIRVELEDGGNLVVQTKMRAFDEAMGLGKIEGAQCRLHDELTCWLVENVPQHFIQGKLDYVEVDIWDSLELVEEFERAAFALRVMGASVLGNSWQKLSKLAHDVEAAKDE